jgi:NAD(P)-dependent dehydrogenase (short-subunit alcohol dehydrogenase family)
MADSNVVVLVTGANGGIGGALCRKYLAVGSVVAAVDMRFDALPAPSTQFLQIEADIGRAQACKAAVDACLARFGRLDVLINNAATVTRGVDCTELEEEEWDCTMNVNLKAAYLLSRHAIVAMRRSRSGVIVNIASQLGHVATKGRIAYSVSKAGLIALTRALAIDHADDGIRAVSVSPGAVMTGRIVARFGGAEAANAVLAPKHPLGRIGTAEEIADFVMFVASGKAGFSTGCDYLVDGGYTAV